MYYNEIKRPDREPDLLLPKYDDLYPVQVWVAERIFYLHGLYRSSISSSAMDLYHCTDPIEYITAVSKFGDDDNPRKIAALDFLGSFDSILLGS